MLSLSKQHPGKKPNFPPILESLVCVPTDGKMRRTGGLCTGNIVQVTYAN